MSERYRFNLKRLRSNGDKNEIRGEDMDRQSEKQRGWSWWYVLFLVQFVAVMWPPFYNKADPSFVGMPFFYWYQLAMVIVGAALTAIVYFATE
jgi:cytosine/uracil/thiamine/allantoin permease